MPQGGSHLDAHATYGLPEERLRMRGTRARAGPRTGPAMRKTAAHVSKDGRVSGRGPRRDANLNCVTIELAFKIAFLPDQSRWLIDSMVSV